MDFMNLLSHLNVDADTLLSRFCGNEGLTKRFLLKFPDDKTFDSLKEAVEKNDVEAILAHAHALKGIALNLGLDSLGNQSSDLVNHLRQNPTGDYAQMFQAISTEYARVNQLIKEYNS